MSKYVFAAFLCLIPVATLGSCTPDKQAKTLDDVDVDLPCTCGQPEAQLEACVHPLCVSEEGNPDNPDCICGPLAFESED